MTVEQTITGKMRWLIITTAALFLCVLTGAVFAAWVNNGPEILLSLGSSALAWCF